MHNINPKSKMQIENKRCYSFFMHFLEIVIIYSQVEEGRNVICPVLVDMVVLVVTGAAREVLVVLVAIEVVLAVTEAAREVLAVLVVTEVVLDVIPAVVLEEVICLLPDRPVILAAWGTTTTAAEATVAAAVLRRLWCWLWLRPLLSPCCCSDSMRNPPEFRLRGILIG